MRQRSEYARDMAALKRTLQETYDGLTGESKGHRIGVQEASILISDVITRTDTICRLYCQPRPQKNKCAHTNHYLMKVKTTFSDFIIKHGNLSKTNFPLLSNGYLSSLVVFNLGKLLGSNVAMQGKVKEELKEAYLACELESRAMKITTWASIRKCYELPIEPNDVKIARLDELEKELLQLRKSADELKKNRPLIPLKRAGSPKKRGRKKVMSAPITRVASTRFINDDNSNATVYGDGGIDSDESTDDEFTAVSEEESNMEELV